MSRANRCTNDPAKRVFLYARTSTKDGRQNAQNQLDALRKEAAARRWEIVEEQTDEISGRSLKTPSGLRRAFILAAAGKIDIVAVHALSRLTRRGPSYTFKLMYDFSQSSVRVVSVTEQLFDGPPAFQEMLMAIAAYIANEESRMMSERIKAGLDRRRASGNYRAGPAKRPVDMAMFAQLRERGLTLNELAAELGINKDTAYRRLLEYNATRAANVDRKNSKT